MVRDNLAIKTVPERIRSNPIRKQKIIPREINISSRSAPRLVRDDLHMKAYRRSTGHLLTTRGKHIRLQQIQTVYFFYTDEKVLKIEIEEL